METPMLAREALAEWMMPARRSTTKAAQNMKRIISVVIRICFFFSSYPDFSQEKSICFVDF